MGFLIWIVRELLGTEYRKDYPDLKPPPFRLRRRAVWWALTPWMDAQRNARRKAAFACDKSGKRIPPEVLAAALAESRIPPTEERRP